MVCVSHLKNSFFFHIPKTAGSYIQHILFMYYDFNNYNDIARFEEDDLLFFFKNKRNQNNSPDFFSKNPWSSKNLGIYKYIETSDSLLSIMNLDKNKFDNMHKFTFVRNPYDRFISSWNFVVNEFKNKNSILFDRSIKVEDLKDIEFFMRNKDKLTDIAYNHVFITQYQHILSNDNTIKMDFIGKVETIEEDLKKVLNTLGFENIIHKVTTKVNKKEHKYYKDYYNQNILEFVNEYFDEDFIQFGYEKFKNIEEFKL